MPERPLLILPTPTEPAKRSKKTGGGGRPHLPSRDRQAERLTPKFTILQETLDARRARLRTDDSTRALHEAVIAFALRAQGTVAVSGYDHPDYRVLDEAGFVRHEVEVQLNVKQERKGMRRKEVLWVRSRA